MRQEDQATEYVSLDESSAVPLDLGVVHSLSLQEARVWRDAIVDRTSQLVSAPLDVELSYQKLFRVGVGVVDVAVELGVAVGLAELDLKVTAVSTLSPLQVPVDRH